ncbi:DUF2285 domain-containing protein [Consotaella aegiceratis]|uniref:DUF2285 domain-containing protein n=1 Tax=Consotaella aegiceratis TaxID=3097961 RepID=UPI002F3F5888
MFWTAEVDPATVLLTQKPVLAAVADKAATPPDAGAAPAGADGVDLAFGAGLSSLHALVLPGIAADDALAAIVPLDADLPERLRALERYRRVLAGRRIPPDDRLTPQRRHTIRQALQAFDGRSCGATHREIAAALFGAGRLADEVWKSSSLRDKTKRLVREGSRLVGGGYRDLFRHRRRD